MINPSDDALPPKALTLTLRRQHAKPTRENRMAYDLTHSSNDDLVANNGQKLKIINSNYTKETVHLALFGQRTSCKAEENHNKHYHDKDNDPDAGLSSSVVTIAPSAA